MAFAIAATVSLPVQAEVILRESLGVQNTTAIDARGSSSTCAVACAGGSTSPAASGPAVSPPDPASTTFDEPILKLDGGLVAEGNLTCLYYRNYVVKRLADEPGGDLSINVTPNPPSSPREPCMNPVTPGGVALKHDHFGFSGLKGNFALLEEIDPNGAMGFAIYDVRNGRLRYEDSFFLLDKRPNRRDALPLNSMSRDGDNLRISYRRAVNTKCSIPKDGQACWARIAREGQIPRALANQPAPVDVCSANYSANHIPFDDESVISYDVDMMLSADGGNHVISRGAVSCQWLP